ncbi:hypothetical protein M406DRAFT_321820 [Cryphonectria parasitica EP155]|uniref:Uncharacterized protein n=1 Tax=Cryphonectria parasitica (strain ATCC 38755 / EP155) TaxID=660469 RepID=A0A9P5CR92_CRYP1|nr:uncharacterized protein M406DRAFT_321820 [Cryphonectria parasitica EP155]KAF3768018.1 hypothetical protein M406DRAFT_321820 [Cryphonectria parasitica EP155]
MPVAVAAKAGVIVASVAVAAAIAIYESPDLQRVANDLRRRIALALQSLGDGIRPEGSDGEPLFNRPEDAQGFLQTEVDADDESRRRQREELMYWNAVKLSKELEQQTAENEKRKSLGSPTSFDDFLTEDKDADEKGSYVFNTGTDVRNNDDGLVRRRVTEGGVRGLSPSMYANPFADEHGIDYDEQMEQDHILSEKEDVMSQDIYNATPQITPASLASRTMSPETLPELISVDPMPIPSDNGNFAQSRSVPQSETTSELPADEYMTAGQDHDEEEPQAAYASIQAWAQQQQPGLDFYSPLPVTPNAPLSEMSDGELISDGQLTPTDSASVAESGVDVAHEVASQDGSSKYYDIMSEDEDGIATPAHSWTEVGSVVSESEDGHQNAQHA